MMNLNSKSSTTAGQAGSDEFTGGCMCGSVRFSVKGKPIRVGLCHCGDCRKASGSDFIHFAVWPREQFQMTGKLSFYAERNFCPTCGSRVFGGMNGEVEIQLGCFDSPPVNLKPIYELWVKRRENWLEPLAGVDQFEQDRPS
jgi:hypothetical protein